ncbi:MAG: 4-hydroxythreonine-4-phosphate dehydrogenase PdxA [Gammaproteobacteria bacterium]|nr:4-hydroxythreonine-4-phosphate dehydrogenase PdxA [Gammaproteobacteria bacterium]
MKAIAITTGEPAGIGPEVSLGLVGGELRWPLVLIGDRELLAHSAQARGLHIDLIDVRADALPDVPAAPGTAYVCHQPLRVPTSAGLLEPGNAEYVLETIRVAALGCLQGRFAGMVTAPVHKGVINDAGIPFSGHTEFLAELAGGVQPVMLLVGGGMRVALATTHLPLSQVSAQISKTLLNRIVCTLDDGLRQQFALPEPNIMVLGLNPHAGEQGHLGREELDIIIPTLEALRARGHRLQGPVPADTAFTRERLRGVDAVLAMYHDQGLPVLKHASFGDAVNVTLGLPFVRTSVDHGTALEIAGRGIASDTSMRTATRLAIELCAGPGTQPVSRHATVDVVNSATVRGD